MAKPSEVEALLAAAASPLPPPACELVPDATLAEDLLPQDLPWLLGLVGRADLSLQDEVEVALHPTLTGCGPVPADPASGWSRPRDQLQAVRLRAGRLARRAPGLAAGRRGPRGALVRPAAPRGGALPLAWPDRHGGLGQPLDPHAQGVAAAARLLAEVGEQLVLVSTPTYDPDANRIQWLWRALRRQVTPTHRRQALVELVADADRWAHTITPTQVLSQIGSPFAPDQQPLIGQELDHAP